MPKKPLLSKSEIINMSMGFLGIQFGFALQNGNASRILQTFGAEVHELTWFWLAAPLTGMLVQPLIGHWSDSIWTRLGRRRPFFLIGAILASLMLVFMPNASFLATIIPPLWVGAIILMFMDASFNVAMEPFRALVGDNLSEEQNTIGFSYQTVLIGIGAVVGSLLPSILGKMGVSITASVGEVPQNVLYSFYIGAVIFMGTILWTVGTTHEYSPKEREKMGYKEEPTSHHSIFTVIRKDFVGMPQAMRQLGTVQFFSWMALFSMWVFMTPAIATHIYHVAKTDTHSQLFQEAGNWVGVIFAVYNGVSALYALALPTLASRIGRKNTHAFSLLMGGVGLLSIFFVQDEIYLIFGMIGVGMAWASILAMPYAMLAANINQQKMGVYMGIFNFFITFPQIIVGIFGGLVLKYIFQEHSIYCIVMAGVFMLCASVSAFFIKDSE